MSINSKILGLRVAGSIFGIVAILHLLRVVTGVSVVIAGWMLPAWVNVLGFAATSALSIGLWALSMKKEDDPRKFYKEKHT
jgi:membrane protein implicated in regulation of membrane protease activity